jgi:hypothetical protein
VQAWKYAYEFNQPLIVASNNGKTINVQLPFNEDIESRGLQHQENSPALPLTFSMLSTQDAVVADLYRQGDQIEAVVLKYDPAKTGTIRVGTQQITVPQSAFTLLPLSASLLKLPAQK